MHKALYGGGVYYMLMRRTKQQPSECDYCNYFSIFYILYCLLEQEQKEVRSRAC